MEFSKGPCYIYILFASVIKTKHDYRRDYINHRLNMITVSRYMDNRCIPVVLSFAMEYCVLDVCRLQCVDDGVNVASHRSEGGVNSPLDLCA